MDIIFFKIFVINIYLYGMFMICDGKQVFDNSVMKDGLFLVKVLL